MTSKAPGQTRTVIPYRWVLPKGFLCPDPEHRPDSMQQNSAIFEANAVLEDHFADRPDVFIDSGGFVFYDQRTLNIRIRPDLYMAFGVDSEAVFSRNGYVIWEAGKPPDFALGVASESTHNVDTNRKDTNRKPAIYTGIGISEYWRFDATGGEYYGYHLAGDYLVDGVYQPFEIFREPDGTFWGYSPLLDLCLCAQGRRLVFYDRKQGRYLQNLSEARASLRQAADQLESERAARQSAEAELERLRAENRRLRGE